MRSKYILIGIVVGVLLASAAVVLAGSIDSPAAPESTSGFTIQDVYRAVNRNNAHNAAPQPAFTEPSSGPGTTGTMHSLDEIMGVLIGSVPKTRQKKCYDQGGTEISCAGTGQDGEKRMGSLPVLAVREGTTGAYTIRDWTDPRFTDNEDGTVTDNVTGLIWLKDADCAGTSVNWATALSYANALYDGCTSCFGTTGDCGLDDDSIAGDWRLPNIHELHSLVDLTQSYPALPPDYPFSGVRSDYYWSSTTDASYADCAWGVILLGGYVNEGSKACTTYVWPVRGGQ
jgi:hypothetical protein